MTADDFFEKALEGMTIGPDIERSKYAIVNSCLQATQFIFSEVVADAYVESLTPLFDDQGKCSSIGSYDAKTKQLSATLENGAQWSSTDIGGLVVFHADSRSYLATVSARIDGNTVVLAGDNLPQGNLSGINHVIFSGTTLSGVVVNLSTVRMLRVNGMPSLTITSSETKDVFGETVMSFNKFRNIGQQNLSKIVWIIVGDYLYFKRGWSLKTYGTITIRYPRLVSEVTCGEDRIDILDGEMVEIAKAILRKIVQERTGATAYSPAENERLRKHVIGLYRSRGAEIDGPESWNKVKQINGDV